MKLITRITTLFILLSIFFVSAFAVFAQEDETPEPEGITIIGLDDEPVELVDFVPTDSPEGELLNSILEAIAAVVYLPAAAGIVVVATSVIKRFTDYRSKYIALTVMILLWGIYSLAANLGYETQIEQILNAITEIGYILIAATGTSIVSAKVYQQAARHEIPVVGYSRHVAEYQRNANQANG